jgi:hypothetical protein
MPLDSVVSSTWVAKLAYFLSRLYSIVEIETTFSSPLYLIESIACPIDYSECSKKEPVIMENSSFSGFTEIAINTSVVIEHQNKNTFLRFYFNILEECHIVSVCLWNPF